MPRVLIAEDSPTVRRLLESIVSSDPALSVVGVAADGFEAVGLAEKLKPDVVTMDVQMPNLDGFSATRQIMQRSPVPVVIVSGHVDVRETRASFQALGAGAVALLPKPPAPTSPEFERARVHFVETLKAMAEVKVVTRWGQRSAAPTAQVRPRRSSDRPRERAEVIAIAASTGGPPAVKQVLAALPSNFPVPILLVQHIAEGFGDGLVSWLDSTVGLRVLAATQGAQLSAGCVYVAPDHAHLVVTKTGVLGLRRSEPGSLYRPSADVLFQTVADTYGQRSCGVILTGMGADGVRGLRALRERGGRVIAQDERSSVVYGMPRAAVEAGIVHRSASLDELPALLLEAAHQRS